jgi:hypothetical protein
MVNEVIVVINDCGDFGVANVLEDVHGDDVVTVLI